jgi:hypothetical protein
LIELLIKIAYSASSNYDLINIYTFVVLLENAPCCLVNAEEGEKLARLHVLHALLAHDDHWTRMIGVLSRLNMTLL